MNNIQSSIATELCTLWRRVPYLRFCQLISDIAGPDNYYLGDETFLRKLREFSKVADELNAVRGKPFFDQSTIDEVARYETE